MAKLDFIFGAVLGCALIAAPAVAVDYEDLTLTFAASKSLQLETLTRPVKTTAETAAPALDEDMILTRTDIFEIAASPETPEGGASLFQNTDLLIQIESVSGKIAHAEVLSTCAALDLVAEEVMFGQSANCDDQTFTLTVDGNTIQVLKNDEVLRTYELEPGNYAINGYPVIFN